MFRFLYCKVRVPLKYFNIGEQVWTYEVFPGCLGLFQGIWNILKVQQTQEKLQKHRTEISEN